MKEWYQFTTFDHNIFACSWASVYRSFKVIMWRGKNVKTHVLGQKFLLPKFQHVPCLNVNSLVHQTEKHSKTWKFWRNRYFKIFSNIAYYENWLYILKIVKSIKLRPKHGSFWTLATWTYPQTKFSPFCNSKFPPISNTSGLGAKFWNSINTVFMRKIIPENVSELINLWFKSARNFVAIRPEMKSTERNKS